jgi:hypothetical protein
MRMGKSLVVSIDNVYIDWVICDLMCYCVNEL